MLHLKRKIKLPTILEGLKMTDRETLVDEIREIKKWVECCPKHIEAAKLKITELEQQLAALDAKEKDPWKPEVGKSVWYIAIRDITWENSGGDKDRWNLGNVYRTREDAVQANRWREIDVKVRRAARASGEVGTQWHCITSVDAMREGITIKHTVERTGGPRFFSKESAQACVDDIGESDIRFWLEEIQ
jgi:hypothetical protein